MWCYERTTRVTEDARGVMWRDAMPVLQAVRSASYGGDFCASESSKVETFRMVVEVFRSEACIEDSNEGNESFGDVLNL